MKNGVRIINCARGGIVNEQDLCEALKSGKVAGAALDVFEKEPLEENSPLYEIDNLVMAPHLGASTKEAQVNVAIDVAEQIISPATYTVALKTRQGTFVFIFEDEQAVWLESEGKQSALSKGKIRLPDFKNHRHCLVLRVLHPS